MVNFIVFYFLVGLLFFLNYMFFFYLKSNELYGYRKIDNFSVKASIFSIFVWPVIALFVLVIYVLPVILNFIGWICEKVTRNKR